MTLYYIVNCLIVVHYGLFECSAINGPKMAVRSERIAPLIRNGTSGRLTYQSAT